MPAWPVATSSTGTDRAATRWSVVREGWRGPTASGIGRLHSVTGLPIHGAVRELLASDAVAQVVTLDEDGSPHVTAAWVDFDGDEIVLATLSDQRKLRNLRRDPRVALSVQTTRVNDWGLLEYLVVYGTVTAASRGCVTPR